MDLLLAIATRDVANVINEKFILSIIIEVK
jgi:hypothetical protein